MNNPKKANPRAQLMQGNEACAEGALRPDAVSLPVIPLPRLLKLANAFPTNSPRWAGPLFRWRTKSPVWVR